MSPPSGPATGTRVLVLTGAAVIVIGLAITVVGGLAVGRAAGLGAAIATAFVVGFFGFGAAVLNVISRVLPAAALLIALMTYTLQVLGVGLAFLAIRRSGLLISTVDATWLGLTMIVLTLVWLAGHLRAATTARIPIYDIPEVPTERQEASTK